jgi:hypothetical protein
MTTFGLISRKISASPFHVHAVLLNVTLLLSLCMSHLAEGEEQCHVAVHALALQLPASLHAFPCGCQLDVHALRLNACRNMTAVLRHAPQ